ncbi:hypothetical protein E4U15_003776 [Claviceps sp. LM218 group G6]|nr:hypothetical protein E4U15_003776 [Claviceps sp. LM218 group G6]
MTTSCVHKIGQSEAIKRKSHNMDDWEEWEDEEVFSPIDAGELAGSCQTPTSSSQGNAKTTCARGSRISASKLGRLTSRKRQKAQNAKAGIRLITDMSAFRRNYPIADDARGGPKARPTKFVDAAALKALEGEPSSASMGNWNWLKKRPGKSPTCGTSPSRGHRSEDQQVSPADEPILIGISLPSSEVMGAQAMSSQPSPPQAPHAPIYTADKTGFNPNAQKSVWSPDTPETSFSFGHWRGPVSSMYSNNPKPSRHFLPEKMAPPSVPVLPIDDFRGGEETTARHQKRVLSLELGKVPREDSDNVSPLTLFEEDGNTDPQRRAKEKGPEVSPDSACSRAHGWWDHVVTPFADKTMSFSSHNDKILLPEEERKEYYMYQDNKHNPAASSAGVAFASAVPTPITRAPTPRETPLNCSGGAQHERHRTSSAEEVLILPVASGSGSGAASTPRVVVTRESPPTSDYPPPYSPPKKSQGGKAFRYRAVFPPGHPLHSHFPPTPISASSGLAGTMSSQRAAPHAANHSPALAQTQTPPLPISAPLPARPAAAFVSAAHVYSTTATRHKVERQRRRHEKEDVLARRAGGFWRGRGCIPSKGCFGRTGREGRQRRRVWMIIWAGILALLLLIILLAVFLTRHHDVAAAAPSIWVNLTDYPPMPTGILTVVGPDNTAAKSGCTEPSTLWSCALPKDDHASALPYRPDQPTLIMQIQWDNGTERAWNNANGEPPTAAASVARRAHGAAALANAVLRRAKRAAKRAQSAVTTSFAPNPAPPSFKEMWFLGETSDNIQSDHKAGEPAPFYISLLPSSSSPVDATPSQQPKQPVRRESSPVIGNATFRNLIPPPDVEADGSSVPAVMMPHPMQQPVRLYDRGLPTEHYGFYTYFKKTIFLRSITATLPDAAQTEGVPPDQEGGCRKTEASHLVTWGETRLRVQIWTRRLEGNISSLLKAEGGNNATGQQQQQQQQPLVVMRPGSMPYPVTITQDTHGGDANKKLVWERAIDDRLRVQQDQAQALVNDMAVGGTWVNRRSSGDARMGGFDGGTGGCKCEWVNWV